MEIYSRDISEIENVIILKIIGSSEGKKLIDKVSLGIKTVIENCGSFKDINDNQVKAVYKFEDLDILANSFKLLKYYTDSANIEFIKVIDSCYDIIPFLMINKEPILDRPNIDQSMFFGTLYFPSQIHEQTWEDIFKKHILEKINSQS
jgi:hypothetical protein